MGISLTPVPLLATLLLLCKHGNALPNGAAMLTCHGNGFTAFPFASSSARTPCHKMASPERNMALLSLSSALAYMLQVLFGDKVQPNVLRNFTGKALQPVIGGPRHLAQAVVWAVRLAYLLSIMASFPLQVACRCYW